MKEITEKELTAYDELLTGEQTVIQKYKTYADDCKDPEIKKLCENAVSKHTEHYNVLLRQIQ